MKKYSRETLCVHEGTIFDKETRGICTPIYPSTSYRYLDTENRVYPRYFNTPNQNALIKKISALENAESGIVFSSGMAAISTTLFTFLKKGDHVIFQKGLYGGTYHFIVGEFANFGIEYTIAEGNAVKDFEKELKSNTKVLYIETPSNPLLTITDVSTVAAFAKRNNLISLMDNTFASPVNQNPIDMGIDIVIHSATKYLGGHSDICAGAVLSKLAYIKRIEEMSLNLGGSLNAETCHLLERSIKTMYLRVNQQNKNAWEVANYLEKLPQVDKVYYPGLESHEGHEIARSQMKGFGGMLSFELNEGLDIISFQKKLQIIKPSMSLGGIESTICASSLTSHRHLSKEDREKEGIKDRLLRLSVGIENVNDLIADIGQAI